MDAKLPRMPGREMVHLPSNMPARLERATSKALTVGKSILEEVVMFSGDIRAASAFILDSVDIDREFERSRCSHLAQYAGSRALNSLALVGNFSIGHPENSQAKADDDALADIVAGTLYRNQVVRPGMAVYIRTMLPSNLTALAPGLPASGLALKESLRRHSSDPVHLQIEDPVRLPIDATKKQLGGVCEAINRAISESEIHADAAHRDDRRRMALSQILIADASRPSELFAGIQRSGLEVAGVARLAVVGKHSEDMTWEMLMEARFVPEASAEPGLETVREVGIDPQADRQVHMAQTGPYEAR